MTTRRMRIDDYELMAQARRSYLAWLDGNEDELSAEQRSDRDLLRNDDRLDKPLFMEWELNVDFDAAICRALFFSRERCEEELKLRAIPHEDLAEYVSGRQTAIDACMKKLFL